MPKIEINEDEAYPIYYIDEHPDGPGFDGFDRRIEVEQATLDRWDEARKAYGRYQRELAVLHRRKAEDHDMYRLEHHEEIEAKWLAREAELAAEHEAELREAAQVIENAKNHTR